MWVFIEVAFSDPGPSLGSSPNETRTSGPTGAAIAICDISRSESSDIGDISGRSAIVARYRAAGISVDRYRRSC